MARASKRPDAGKIDEAALRGLPEQHGQGHVFRFWGELSGAERTALLEQLSRIDFNLLDRLVRAQLLKPAKPAAGKLTPAPIIPIPGTDQERIAHLQARQRGEELLRQGKVAAFVVAGGQGTRLGFDGPKGTFVIGPVSRRTLFQVHAEKIRASARRYGAPVPWLVMTSESNHQATADFFRKNESFGMEERDVFIFQQEMLPAVDRKGKVFMESKSRVFTSPNGHGGSIKALSDSGALEELARRGIEAISYFQVDNPLVNPCDPVFLGYHALHQAEMSSKVVRKRDWSEKVGVLGRRDGKLAVIEYSDLPESDARATLPDGSLKYWAGSIAIHLLSVEFARRLNRGGFQLPYHVAEKSVPSLDDRGSLVKPKEKNGIKFETFVFDALGETRRSVSLEVRREEEFSPVKNAAGEDSPEQSRRDLTALYLRWLEAAGARIERGNGGAASGYVEISPLTALDGEELARRLKPGTVVRSGFIL
ncbi:MAG: UDPGP type 1 family protein [Planctomycetes bacterium]|nr:UDPGP type 1 family protein [Planctomycetota bacterium]